MSRSFAILIFCFVLRKLSIWQILRCLSVLWYRFNIILCSPGNNQWLGPLWPNRNNLKNTMVSGPFVTILSPSWLGPGILSITCILTILWFCYLTSAGQYHFNCPPVSVYLNKYIIPNLGLDHHKWLVRPSGISLGLEVLFSNVSRSLIVVQTMDTNVMAEVPQKVLQIHVVFSQSRLCKQATT